MKRQKDGSGAKPIPCPASFEAFYSGLYGERWVGLAAALAFPSPQVGLRILEGGGFDLSPAGIDGCDSDDEPTAGPTARYFLDPSSVEAALALDLPTTGQVLDACAAPGGKSLVIAARMGSSVRLLANELSSERRHRLQTVLDAFLPKEVRVRVSIFGADASALCLRRPSAFDAILLDAPCSSERHVLQDPSALAAWTASRPRSLANRQWALLSSAFHMLAPGGCLVYSTCSINPGENDGVVDRLVKKHGASLVVQRASLSGGEATEHGVLVLPDHAVGRGPMYVFKMRKSPKIPS